MRRALRKRPVFDFVPSYLKLQEKVKYDKKIAVLLQILAYIGHL